MENLPAPATQSAPATGNDNHWFWAIGGFVLGLMVMNYKNKKAMAATVQNARDEEWNKAHENVEKLLQTGQQMGLQPVQILKIMRGDSGFI